MIKKGLLVGGALALLLVLFFGRDVVSYVKTTVANARTAVRESVPITFELERARKMIQELDPEISRHKREIAREEMELEKLEEQIAEDEAKLAKSWGQIQQLRGDLQRGDSNYVYARRTYSFKEVESDLTSRFARYQTKEATVDKLQQIAEARRRGLTAAQDKLKEMINAKRQLEVEVENLEARQKMVEVAKAASDFNIDDSQLSRTKALLNDIEARIEVDAQLVNADDYIPDEIPLDEPEEDATILERITEYETSKGAAEESEEIFVGMER
jgi:DNA repair exonuclease SbcCD ATPase subunit